MRSWDEKRQTFEFVIHSWSDFNYVKNPENLRSILGTRVFIKVCPIMFRSGTQQYVCMTVTEAKLSTSVIYVQDMLYVM